MVSTRRQAHQRALVTGGCGFLGRHLVQQLLESGRYEVTVLDIRKGDEEGREGLHYLVGDLRKLEDVVAATKGGSRGQGGPGGKAGSWACHGCGGTKKAWVPGRFRGGLRVEGGLRVLGMLWGWGVNKGAWHAEGVVAGTQETWRCPQAGWGGS